MPQTKPFINGVLWGSATALLFGALIAILKYYLYVSDITHHYGDSLWETVHYLGFELLVDYLIGAISVGLLGAFVGALLRTAIGRGTTLTVLVGSSVCLIWLTPGTLPLGERLSLLSVVWVCCLVAVRATELADRKAFR